MYLTVKSFSHFHNGRLHRKEGNSFQDDGKHLVEPRLNIDHLPLFGVSLGKRKESVHNIILGSRVEMFQLLKEVRRFWEKSIHVEVLMLPGRLLSNCGHHLI